MTNVLIVEDDAIFSAYLQEVLEAAGFGVTQCRHAIDAIEAIDNNKPDVIFLDLLLPATTGLALLHELQTYDDTSAIPVILCTSLADVVPADSIRSYGVNHVLDKTTMKPDDIVAAVKRVVL